MEISPISISQQNFRGTVDKSVKKYVKRAVSNECHAIVDKANQSGTIVAQEELIEVKQQGKKIIKMLSDFFGECQADTKISFVSRSPFSKRKEGFVISNRNLPKKAKTPLQNAVISAGNLSNKAVELIRCYGDSISNLSHKTGSGSALYMLESIVELLTKKTKPQEVDELLLHRAQNLAEEKAKSNDVFHEIIALDIAAKADNFAGKIGKKLTTHTVKDTVNLIEELNKQRLEKQTELDKIKRLNKDTLENVL